MAKRHRIKIQEILDMQKRRKQINKFNLSNIDLIDNEGKILKIAPSVIENFKFIGLNNIDFIAMGIYKKKRL